MILNRYLKAHTATPEQLAKITVDERYSASFNSNAIHFGEPPVTVADVLASPIVVDPIHRLEMTISCAGAAAVILTSAERAARLKHPPIYLLGAGECHPYRSVSCAPTLDYTGGRAAADAAFHMSGLRREDMGSLCIYDCYTCTVLLTLEDTGFVPRGAGGKFIEEHNLRFDGDFPVNPHGGQLGCGHWDVAAGMSLVTAGVRELMSRAGPHQVKNAEFAFVNGTGGAMSSNCAPVLGRNR
jgi:acetyl-CoA acetyltransferase